MSSATTIKQTKTGNYGRASYWRPLRVCLAEATIALCAVGAPTLILTGALPQPWNVIPIFLGLAVAVPAVRRAFRVSLEISQSGVIVANYWRVYRLTWSEIEHIFIGINTLGIVPLRAIVFRRSGHRRILPATASTAAGNDRARMLRELERHAHLHGIRFSINAER